MAWFLRTNVQAVSLWGAAPIGARRWRGVQKVLMITGGSRGIGYAVAEAYARLGYAVALSGHADRERLDEAVAGLKRIQPAASGELVDVRDARAVDRWVDEVAGRFGRIDVAVSNAGVIHPAPFLELSEGQWDEVVGTHLKGTFLFLRSVARVMVEKRTGGSLITVTAPTAVRGGEGVADYASAKGGILALTRNMAKELASHGIRVNSVLPVAETRMTDALIRYRKIDPEAWNRRFPLSGGMPSARDVVGPFLFLGSDDSKYVTGNVITVDAGSGL